MHSPQKSLFFAVLIIFWLLSLIPVQLAQNEQRLIAFISTGREGSRDIFMMNADGTRVINLTNSPGDEYNGVWSPDGTTIAFTIYLYDNYYIQKIDVNSLKVSRLTKGSTENFMSDWSPDGTKILFVSTRDGNNEIYTMSNDGIEVTRLTNTEVNEYSPVWSPDGTQIAFINDSTEDISVYLMDADGSNIRVVPNTAGRNTGPVWSPDGKLAFSIDTPEESSLYIINPDGSNRIMIDHRQRGYAYGGMTWYPNDKLAFFASDQSAQLIIYNPAFQSKFTLQGPHIDQGRDPFWSPPLNKELPVPTATIAQPDPRFDRAPHCPNSPPSRLGEGMIARFTPQAMGNLRQNLRVRKSPNGAPDDAPAPGQEFKIVEQGVCGEDDGLLWWHIQTSDGGVDGWSVEGYLPDRYFIEPVSTR